MQVKTRKNAIFARKCHLMPAAFTIAALTMAGRYEDALTVLTETHTTGRERLNEERRRIVSCHGISGSGVGFRKADMLSCHA